MKILILFLLYSFSTMAEVKDICPALEKEYLSFENELRHQTITKCEEFKAEDETLANFSIEDNRSNVYDGEKLKKSTTHADQKDETSLLSKVRCKDVAFLEQRIRDVESELNTLLGFEKLVTTIQNSQKTIVDKKADRLEIEGFIQDVGDAARLESFVSNQVFFDKLQAPDFLSTEIFKKAINTKCAEKVKELKNICDDLKASPANETTVKSLESLFHAYLKSQDKDKSKNKEANKLKLLEKWKAELAITKTDAAKTPYSFAQMHKELTEKPLDSHGDQVKAIKSLPQISRVESHESTVNQLFTNYATKKLELDAKVEIKKLLNLQQDLKVRQEQELKSRLSLVWNEFGPSNSTADTYQEKFKALKLVSDDMSNKGSPLSTHLDDALRALMATDDQVKKLSDITKCLGLNEDTIELRKISEACKEKVDTGAMNENKKKLLSELSVLENVKNRITDSDAEPKNAQLLVMRNLSIEALVRNKCTSENSGTPDMSDCGVDILSKEIKNLVLSGLDISLNYAKATDTDFDKAKDICNESQKKKENRYYDFCKAITSGLPSKKDHSKESVNGPLAPESNTSNDHLFNGLQNLVSTLFPIQQPNRGPYYYTPQIKPFTGGYPTISESLIGSSVYSGALRPYVPMAAQPVTPNYFAYRPVP